MLQERWREAADSGAGGPLHLSLRTLTRLPIPISGVAARADDCGDPDPADALRTLPCLPAAVARTGVASMKPEVFARRNRT